MQLLADVTSYPLPGTVDFSKSSIGTSLTDRCVLQDRLDTLQSVREAGISVCAGGIIGLGEGPKDRVGLIHQLATLPEHPESVPINALVAVAGKHHCYVDKKLRPIVG